MRDLVKPAVILFVVSVLVVVLLAFTDHLTAPVIAQRAQADLDDAKRAVLPAAQTFTALTLPEGLAQTSEGLGTVRGAWTAQDASGAMVGVIVTSASKGYGGPVVFTVGIDTAGKVTGVRAGSHKETPGLGDKVIAASSKVMKQLAGAVPTGVLKTVKAPPGPNEIDAIAGSTITSRAAVRAVSGAWELSTRVTPEGAWK